MFGRRKRLEKEIVRASLLLFKRLDTEMARGSDKTNEITGLLYRLYRGQVTARLQRMAFELLERQHYVGTCKLLKECCNRVYDRIDGLSDGWHRLSKDIQENICTMIWYSTELQLFELDTLANLLQRLYGSVVKVAKESCTKGQPDPPPFFKRITKEMVDKCIEEIVHSQTTSSSSLTLYPPRNTRSSPIQRGVNPLSPAIPIRIIRPNARLEIAFDVRTKNLLYVLERMDGIMKEKEINRPKFYEELRIPKEFRSRLSSFVRSGYDRGHMAPAGDFGDASVGGTFNLCNISPQDHWVNATIWVRLENWCRKVASVETLEHDAQVCVVTGPLWLPTLRENDSRNRFQYSYLAIGNPGALVHVPTHFFKILAVIWGEAIVKFACFVVPNSRPAFDGSNLLDFSVGWDDIERLSGLEFFPNLVDSNWKEIAQNAVVSAGAKPLPPITLVGSPEVLFMAQPRLALLETN
eukprot:Nitzschia sp. Nitz4//scaffold175_size95217//68928//70403//NITZ4_004731-RA/size95217-snap-gene-0.60-mRNA-1//1//CDS//3329538963//2933//frame0